MKKIYILEKLYTQEETKQSIAYMEESLSLILGTPQGTEETIKTIKETIFHLKQKLTDYPDGYWLGFEGKFIYSQFCYTAKAAIRRNPQYTFRVVTAEIEDNAKYWIGYKNPQVNEGVLRYLMATK